MYTIDLNRWGEKIYKLRPLSGTQTEQRKPNFCFLTSFVVAPVNAAVICDKHLLRRSRFFLSVACFPVWKGKYKPFNNQYCAEFLLLDHYITRKYKVRWINSLSFKIPFIVQWELACNYFFFWCVCKKTIRMLQIPIDDIYKNVALIVERFDSLRQEGW